MQITPLTPDYISRHHAGEWFGGFRRPQREKYAASSPSIRASAYYLDTITLYTVLRLGDKLPRWQVQVTIGRN